MPINPQIPLMAAQNVPQPSNRLGMAMQAEQLGAMQRQRQAAPMQMQSAQIDMAIKRAEFVGQALTGPYMTYETMIKKGATPEVARAQTQPAYMRSLQGLAQSGVFKPEELQRIPTEFDPEQARSAIIGTKQFMDHVTAQRQQQATQLQQDRYDLDSRRADEAERHNRALEGKAQDETFSNPVDETDGSGKPVRVQYGNRGTRRVIAGAQPAPKGRGGQLVVDPETGQMSYAPGGGTGLKEGEGKSVTYGVRAAAGLKKLEELEDNGYNPANEKDRFAAKVPGGNYVMSGTGQKYAQAEREFLGAVLRKDTGAAVTPGEMEFYGEQFFPRAGDSSEVIKQKREARRTAFDALKAGSGAGQPLIPDVPATAPRGGAIPQGWSVTVKP